MNPELKQRLIGAVVVTALAAIFIPMLFDDPVENSSQSVTSLPIPATPINTGEESANKLPTSANQVLNAPDAGSETVVDTQEEAELSASPPADEALIGEPAYEEETGAEQASDEPVNDNVPTDTEALDAASVDEAKPPKKAQEKPPKQKSHAALQADDDAIVATPQKAVKATTTSTPKQATKAKQLATEPAKTEKVADKPQKSSPSLSRWTIQAGTFSKKDNALALMETLRKQGLPVTLDSSKGLYRLKVGPVLDKKRALDMKAKLDSQKISSLLIAE